MRAWIAWPLPPALQGMSDALGPVIGKAARNDEQSCMELAGLEEGGAQFQEIIPVARDEDILLRGREPELFLIVNAPPIDLVNGENVQSKPARNLSDRGIEILIEEESHSRSYLAVARP